jgi:hypothetical protein
MGALSHTCLWIIQVFNGCVVHDGSKFRLTRGAEACTWSPQAMVTEHPRRALQASAAGADRSLRKAKFSGHACMTAGLSGRRLVAAGTAVETAANIFVAASWARICRHKHNNGR